MLAAVSDLWMTSFEAAWWGAFPLSNGYYGHGWQGGQPQLCNGHIGVVCKVGCRV